MQMRELMKGLCSLLASTMAKGAAAQAGPNPATAKEPIERQLGQPLAVSPGSPSQPYRQAMEGYLDLTRRALEHIGLSPAQQAIALLVMQALPYAEIAKRLDMTESNVRYHMRNSCALAQVPDRHGFERYVHAVMGQMANEAACADAEVSS